MRRAETTTYRARILNACGLGYLLQSDRIAHAFKSLESPLTFAFLLSRPQAIIPFLLIKRPREEQRVDDHQIVCATVTAAFLPPKRASRR